MVPWSVRFVVRSWKLRNVSQDSFLGWVIIHFHWMGDQKFFYYHELLRALEDTLSRWSRLHFAVVSTHQPALGPRGGLWPDLLMCNP
jgi:hypothetical protein